VSQVLENSKGALRKSPSSQRKKKKILKQGEEKQKEQKKSVEEKKNASGKPGGISTPKGGSWKRLQN